MNRPGVERRLALDQHIRDRESQTAENVAAIRLAKEQWESYGQVMILHARRIEAAGAGEDAKNYFTQRRSAARREVDSYVTRMVNEEIELLDDAERELCARSEEELARLVRERAGASWD